MAPTCSWRWLAVVSVVACSGPDEAPGEVPAPTDSTGDTAPTGDSGTSSASLFAAEPVAALPAALIGGARQLSVEATEPAALVVALTGPEGTRTWSWPEAASHEVPIVGMRAGAPYELTVTLQSAAATEQRVLPLTGDPWPANVPELQLLAVDPGGLNGHTLFTATSPDYDAAWALLLDEAAQPVWWALLETRLGDLRRTDDDTLLGLGDFDIVELDWLGRELRHWSSIPNSPHTRLAIDLVHHEAFPLPDGGVLTLDQALVDVPDLPVSYTELDQLQPTTVIDNGVVELDATGEVVRRVPLTDVLQTSRVGFNSLDPTALGAPDWAHANAVVPDDDGGWVVSLRHQDALVKIDDQGELVWILGDPSGWVAPWSDALLTPEGDLSWPYHPHAPELRRVDGELRVLLFDNGNEGHTPYTAGPPSPPASRLVEFAVDESAGTVRELWAYEHADGAPLAAFALGDADRLDEGDVLGVWGMLDAEGGVANTSTGRGNLSARLVQVDPSTGQIALDLRVGSSLSGAAGGWSVYRAERLVWPEAQP